MVYGMGQDGVTFFYGMYYFVILLAEVAVEPLRDNILEICHLDKNALPYRILQTLKTWLIIFTGELFFQGKRTSGRNEHVFQHF